MIGYCPSAGRIQPRHLLSFSTNSIAIAQVANTLSHNTHIVFLPLSRSPYRSFFLSILFSLTFSLFSSQPCATSTCLVPFVLESMPQLTSGKKNRTARWETVSTQGQATVRSDRFIAATADGRLCTPRFFSSLFAGSSTPDHAFQP